MVRRKQLKQPKTPECDRLSVVQNESQSIGEFLEWLQQEKGVFLARYEPRTEMLGEHEIETGDHDLVPYQYSVERLLAERFDINLDRVEHEKRAVLDYLRKKAAS